MGFEFDLSRFHFRIVEDIVQEREQDIAAIPHDAELIQGFPVLGRLDHYPRCRAGFLFDVGRGDPNRDLRL